MPSQGGVPVIDGQRFKEEVIPHKGLAIVAFSATWCGPCRIQADILKELMSEVGSDILIRKVDIDQATDIGVSLNIMSVPTLFIYRDGDVVHRKIGVSNLKELRKFLQQFA